MSIVSINHPIVGVPNVSPIPLHGSVGHGPEHVRTPVTDIVTQSWMVERPTECARMRQAKQTYLELAGLPIH
jgi:hypothetical protein